MDTGNATTRLSLIDIIRRAVPEYADVSFKSSLDTTRKERPTVFTLDDSIRKGQQLRQGELTFDNDVFLPRLRVDYRALGQHLRGQLIS